MSAERRGPDSASPSADEARVVQSAWNAVAARYRSCWSPRLLPYLKKAVATFHPAPPGPLAVPGCGPGEEVLLLAEHFPDRSIVATDTAAEMVAILREQLGERAIGTVMTTVGRAEDLSSYVRQAAGVLSCFTLDLLPDPLAALADWARCLRRGGSLVVMFWPRPRTGSPAARLQSVLQAKTGKGRLLWEARAADRLRKLSLKLVRDERVQFEVPWDTPEEYFKASFDAGPLQVVRQRYGPELIRDCLKTWLVNHCLRRAGSTWVDVPEARLWVLEQDRR